MAELLLELLSEEIPARMQRSGAETLAAMLGSALAALSPRAESFYGPRRIAVVAELAAEVPASSRIERGPRSGAPEQALAGFLRKHGATREQLADTAGYWTLSLTSPPRPAALLIADALPMLLRRFAWPRSMRWGGSSAFTWVRPLRRILCLLDGQVVPFDLRDGDDDGHDLASGNVTEGHHFTSPAAYAVSSRLEWQQSLRERSVVVDAAERVRLIGDALAALLAPSNLTLIEDTSLLEEVAGLVEWPVPLLGRIDPEFMDLPPEVMQVSMRVNQRYFALRDRSGGAAPWFAFVANVAAADGGAMIVAGNERVLRARFADARHFWDADRKVRLEDRLPSLAAVAFHAKLGSQRARAGRLASLAGKLAPVAGAASIDAARAGVLAKADLTCGMVGEFPELQGVMGSYYARHDGEADDVCAAIAQHYLPKGPSDPLPDCRAGIAVALADKLDTLAGFFSIGEMPTGSSDPYALRRAALGLIRIVRERHIALALRHWLRTAVDQHDAADCEIEPLLEFIMERLRAQLRGQGARYDVLNAVIALTRSDEILELLRRARDVEQFLAIPAGADLLAIYRRADNILRIETRRDGPKEGLPRADLFETNAERDLYQALQDVGQQNAQAERSFTRLLGDLATLRQPGDAFFEQVLVNADAPEIRHNRLCLLGQLRDTMNQVADFSKIEG